MTNVGKILVVLIAFAATGFMFLAVTVFTTRINWKNKYDEQLAEYKKLQEKKASLDTNIQTLTQAITVAVDNHKRDRDSLLVQTKNQQSEYATLLENLKQARSDVAKYETRAAEALAEARARVEESLGLRKQLDETQKEKREAIKKQFELNQQLIELQDNFETIAARLNALTERETNLVAVLRSYGIFDETTKDERTLLRENPPDIQGVVTEADTQGKHIQISVGSDDGLRKGHRLHIFRLKPEGKYLGQIELIEVDSDKSVGRIVPTLKRGNIQEGDRVSNRIAARD